MSLFFYKTTFVTGLLLLIIGSESAWSQTETFEKKVITSNIIEVVTSKHEGISYIQYRQGDDKIDLGYKNNAQEMEKIFTDLIRLAQSPRQKILSISITGYGSPEGKFDVNKIISDRRANHYAQLVQDTLLKHVPQEVALNVASVAEDWDGLKRLIEQNLWVDSINFTKALQIINTVDIFDGREKAIMDLNRGDTYRYFFLNFFPQLRRTQYRIDYSDREEYERTIQDTVVIVRKIQQPEQVYYKATYQQAGPLYQRRVFGFSTNLLYWGVATPNLSLDFHLTKKLSLGVTGMYANWDINKQNPYSRILWKGYSAGADLKYWFKNNNSGHYIGIGGSYFDYDMLFREKGHMGSGYGAGILYGYSLQVTPRFNVLFDIGFGAYKIQNTSYRLIRESDENGEYSQKQETGTSNKFRAVPTKAGISLVFSF